MNVPESAPRCLLLLQLRQQMVLLLPDVTTQFEHHRGIPLGTPKHTDKILIQLRGNLRRRSRPVAGTPLKASRPKVCDDNDRMAANYFEHLKAVEAA
jgi:hypothetical protein